MALSIISRALAGEIKRSKALPTILNRALRTTRERVVLHTFHEIEPKLARWQDRANADRFHVTHEFLSYMLGVRREGVTAAAGSLHRRLVVDYPPWLGRGARPPRARESRLQLLRQQHPDMRAYDPAESSDARLQRLTA
jgi:hypothetical protein